MGQSGIGNHGVLNSAPTMFVVLPFLIYCELVSKGEAAVSDASAVRDQLHRAAQIALRAWPKG